MILLKNNIRLFSNNDNDGIAKALESYFDNDSLKGDYSFKASTKKLFNRFAGIFLSILVGYFNKYPEAEFHHRMNNVYPFKDMYTGQTHQLTGFDYVGDFKKFHGAKFKTYIYMFKAQKGLITFDETRMMHAITNIFQIKRWNVSQQEMQGIYTTMKRLKNILYYSKDSIADIR